MSNQNHFSKTLSKKTDGQLLQYLKNPKKYTPEAVEAAVAELKKRGHNVESVNEIQEKIRENVIDPEADVRARLGIPVKTVIRSTRFYQNFVDGIVIYGITTGFSIMFPHVSFPNLGLYVFLLYFILFEYFLQRTPGKLVFNTIVVDKNGEKPLIGFIVLRSMIRLIPFECFSFLDYYTYGWHDRWSKTYVIDEMDLNELRSSSDLPPVSTDIENRSSYVKVIYAATIFTLIYIILSLLGAHLIISEVIKELNN